MESDKLYKVQREDLPELEKMLNLCFCHDPLYETLIPDPEIRKNLMPELFHCDMDEFYETCEIFADTKDLNGLLVVSDEAEPYNMFQFYFSEAKAQMLTDAYLIKEDPSLKTLHNFLMGKNYLNSSWTEQLPNKDQRLHIIYLAVNPKMQHHGIADELMEEAIRYAEKNDLMISLETHNQKNVTFYQQYGFQVYGTLKTHFDLEQYCLIRDFPRHNSNMNLRDA